MICESCIHWASYQAIGIAHGHALRAEEVGLRWAARLRYAGVTR